MILLWFIKNEFLRLWNLGDEKSLFLECYLMLLKVDVILMLWLFRK